MENIFELVKTAEHNLVFGKPIKIGKYAEHDHAEKIATVDAYLNSQHISGKNDSLGREKPFFNISIFSAYTWYKMTDIDRKDISFRAPNSKQRLKALVATLKLRKWMNKKNFGTHLNKWGWTLAAYGSAVSKYIEKDGKLIPSVVSWDRMICDPLDFNGNIKAEKIFYTPAQLRKQGYDEEAVEEAIKTFSEARENLQGEKVDIKNEYIGVYEVHHELPLSLLTDKEEDNDVYRQQMHVIFMHKGNSKSKNDEKLLTLYRGKEKKDPYYLSHLIDFERTLSVGAVESVFDPQWMVNDSAKKIKDQLDLASKLLSQTDDPNFLGRNLVTDTDTGDVMITSEGKRLLPINNQSHDIPQIMNNMNQWKSIGKEITGAHDSVTGQQPPSGTPYRLQMMLNTVASGLFNIMKQNKSLHLEEIIRIHILDYFKKTLKDSEELIAVLDGEDLETFDKLALPSRLESQIMSILPSGHIPTREELMGAVEQENNDLGNVRILTPSLDKKKTWLDYFKNLEWDIEIDIAGENRDKASIITSLNTLLERMMSAPQMFAEEDIKKVFNKIVDEIGVDVISPLQFSKGVSPGMGTPTGGELPPIGGGAGGPVGMPEELTI